MKLSTGVKYGLALLGIFGIALFLRIYFPYHNVFRDGWVNFQETDCYYNMRQVEILARNFPHRMLFDPYFVYPGGGPIGSPPFFYLLLGFLAWLFGAGSPTQKVIETVGAYLPAILGALVTVPVYFAGKELFNRKAGLLAAALIAILPGQFLWRTMLGFPDYHVAETLFSAFTMMFLILALKSSRQKEISFESLRKRDWAKLRRPLLYALLTGIALGLYLLTWVGAGLFIFIIFVFAVIQYIMDHLRGRSTDYICIVSVVSFLVALLMMAISWNGYANWNLGFASLLIGILVFLALGAISFLMTSRNMSKIWYPVALVGLGGIGLGLFYLIDPSLLRSILDRLEVFTPAGGMLTVAEVKGLSISSAWQQFTTCFYLALISLAIMLYLAIKDGIADKTLLFVWSLIMLVATFGQNRFAYYLAVNVALLSAYLPYRLFEFIGFREVTRDTVKQEDAASKKSDKEREKVKQSKKAKRKKAKAQRREQKALAPRYLTVRNFYGVAALVVVFFVAFYPNIGVAVDRVEANTGLSDDWHEALVWMRTGNNTEDPFADLNNPDFYYELHQRPPAGEAYQYPESAYGVMSWWDYGYFITYIAHRIPNANPSQLGAPDAALFFTAQDEEVANEVLDRLGTKYIIIDSDMAIGKYYAMVVWAGKNVEDFFDTYYSPQNGRLAPQRLYLRAYYESMCSRLYNFGGEAWVPSETKVISWSWKEVTDAEGNRYTVKVVSAEKTFNSYEQAEAFIRANPDYIIVGDNPFISPVPLEALVHYELIHKSPNPAVTRGNETISYVEIFKYSP
jgi:dolichyl-diphosphooligosaccharide--protein glycosyltransferase